MEKKIETLPLDEIRSRIESEDLQMKMTLGITLSGSYQNLLSLRTFLESDPRFNVIYKMISSVHLRVVKCVEWDEFNKWKKENAPR